MEIVLPVLSSFSPNIHFPFTPIDKKRFLSEYVTFIQKNALLLVKVILLIVALV
jgi:hypothetical protein